MEEYDISVVKENIYVYIKTNASGRITAVNSSIFINDTENWLKIDEGTGDKYAHAQGNYFDKPLIDERGLHNYIFENGAVRETTENRRRALRRIY